MTTLNNSKSDVLSQSYNNVKQFTFTSTVATTVAGGRAQLGIPSYTTTQRDAITDPGIELIFNSTTGKLNFYTGSAWEAVTSA